MISAAPARAPRNASRSLRLAVSLAWLFATVAMASLAAGCGPRWPAIHATYHSEFAADPGRVATVDVLPVDIDVAIAAGMDHPPSLAESINRWVTNETVEELSGLGYRVTLIDWRGRYLSEDGRGQAMDEQVVANTTDSLHVYGEAREAAIAVGRSEPLAPHLPAKLGEQTGSDATLYVGGKAYVAKPRKTTGEKVAITVGIIAVIAVVVVVVVAIAAAGEDSPASSGRSKGGKARGRSGSGKGKLPAIARRTRDHRSSSRSGSRSSSRTRSGSRVAPVRDHRAGSSSSVRELWPRAGRTTRDHRSDRGAPDRAAPTSRDGADVDLTFEWYDQPVDSMGHSDTHIRYVSPRYYPRVVEPAKHAWVELEMTLVDNQTGAVQWHARQKFKVAPQNARHLRKAVRKMLETLPTRVVATPPSGH